MVENPISEPAMAGDAKGDEQALPVSQTSWVVPDLEAATRPWIDMGVGPFFVYTVDVPDALYRGRVVPLTMRTALAQAGPVQIEFIEQLSQGPSAYRDVVAKGGSGFHHISRQMGGYDSTVARAKAQGAEIVTEAVLGNGRFCYADTRATLGCMLEILDWSLAGERLFAIIADAARGWDGRDPIRPLDLGALMH